MVNNPKNLIRALRLPFVSASVLPFIFGSLLSKVNFSLFNFSLGIISVVATHLSANLINDYADSKSGADWQDTNFYKFFGGSKLIQEKVLPEKFYLNLSVACLAIAVFSIIRLALTLKSSLAIFLFLLILGLAWSYSAKPIAFSYHRLGEVIIFILFGPVLVMGGYFIQTKIFPTLIGFLLSLPFGFLTTAILFSNEVPDFCSDRAAGKFTWVSLTGQKNAYIIFIVLELLAFIGIVICVVLGFLKPLALVSFIFIHPVIKATKILKENFSDKKKLMESSKLTVMVQVLVSVVLILAVIL